MTTQHIHLGGADRPISFANQVAYNYELATGRVYHADIVRLMLQIEAAAAAMRTDRMEDAVRSVSTVLVADLVHAALAYACRLEKTPVDFGPDDVAAWLLDDRDAVGILVGMMAESMPRPDESADAKKKPTVSKPTKVPPRR